jgi:hypothetical protein
MRSFVRAAYPDSSGKDAECYGGGIDVLFCPKCMIEYSEGIWMCADCGVPLVRELFTVKDSKRSGEAFGFNGASCPGERAVLPQFQTRVHSR